MNWGLVSLLRQRYETSLEEDGLGICGVAVEEQTFLEQNIW